jgi:hypothetical protein
MNLKTNKNADGCNRPSVNENQQSNYSITLPILHTLATDFAKCAGCQIKQNHIVGTPSQIEAFMKLQNPMYQSKYNSSKYLNGAWNPLSRTLEGALPEVEAVNIIMSASVLRSDKSVSTGFTPVIYDNFSQLGEAMHHHAHTSAVFSPICRYDTYQNRMKWDWRRRLHNISFVGNVMAYDFDNGTLAFLEAVSLLKENDLKGLVIRSKSDPKYDYDRFKLLIQTDFFFPVYQKDEAPQGFQKVPFSSYKDIYIGLAQKFGFWKYADHSTTDPSRLIAQVNNSDHERREHVAV